MQVRAASDQSLIVYFDTRITREAHLQVVKLLRLLATDPIPAVRNLNPAYCSLHLRFDPLQLTHADLEVTLREYVTRLDDLQLPDPKLVEIRVRYGGDAGPDLDDVAILNNMKPAQVIELHTSATYLVYFLGFVPGFAYLGGLPEKIATPRLATPRRSVPKGSVGIAGNQTGVYPFATPGGWRLIGRTSQELFQPDRDNMSLLSIGDHVRFIPE